MKKLIYRSFFGTKQMLRNGIALLVVLVAIGFSNKASAQFGKAYTFPLAVGDTLINTDTAFRPIPITGGYNELSFQVVLNKVSGTVAGKIYLLQSLDGANYTVTDSASYVPVSAYSKVTPTGTHIAIIQKQNAPSCNYLLMAVSSGTMNAPATFSYVARITATRLK
jgi:hypothetical protein